MQDVSSQRKAAENSGFFFYCQSLIQVRVRCFSKSLFFSLTRTQNSKKPYFTILPCRDVKKSSQRKADVFRPKFDVKMGDFFMPHNLDFL